MRAGDGKSGRIFARNARKISVAVAAGMAVVGMATPLAAATPKAGPVLPAGSWAVTRTADGHLRVVTGKALDQVVSNAAADAETGSDAAGSTILSVQSDQPVAELGTAGENDPMRSQQWALDKTTFE